MNLLFDAAETCNLGALRSLVENKANINVKNQNKNYILHLAARSSSPSQFETIRYLVENKADIHLLNKYNDSILHLAARSDSESQFDAVRYLVEHKADIHLLNILNFTERSSSPTKKKSILYLKYLTNNNVNSVIAFKEQLGNYKFEICAIFEFHLGNDCASVVMSYVDCLVNFIINN
jgi:ankyrin repeat protein